MKKFLALGFTLALVASPAFAADEVKSTTTTTTTQTTAVEAPKVEAAPAVKVAPVAMASATPAPNAKLATAPSDVHITFTQGVSSGKAQLVYMGGPPSDLSTSVSGTSLTAKLPADMSPGIYRVQWSVSNATTPKMNGSFGFQIVSPEAKSTTTTTTTITTKPAESAPAAAVAAPAVTPAAEAPKADEAKPAEEKKKNLLGF